MDILKSRLLNQRLTAGKFNKPEDVVSHFGAIQAQDYSAAKWSLALRLAKPTDDVIEQALADGKIIRTHMLRPTWHFVVPEDIRSFLTLTAPRIKKANSYTNKKLGLSDYILEKSNKIIARELHGNNYLTRQEIKKVLEQENISTDVQRLGHIVLNAEIDQVITSGPKRGKQFTYALLDERVPKLKIFNRNKALAQLAKKYFTSHGPAQLKDFAWWSGLSIKDATEGLQMIGNILENITSNGKTYWFPNGMPKSVESSQDVFLVSVYDEYFISYTDRSDILDNKHKFPVGNALLTSLIILNGKVAGTWKRTITKNTMAFTLFPFEKLSVTNREAIKDIIDDYGNFFGKKTVRKEA